MCRLKRWPLPGSNLKDLFLLFFLFLFFLNQCTSSVIWALGLQIPKTYHSVWFTTPNCFRHDTDCFEGYSPAWDLEICRQIIRLQRCAFGKALKCSKIWQTWQAMRSQTAGQLWCGGNPFKPLQHMVWITYFIVWLSKASKRDYVFRNVRIINTMKTRHKIRLTCKKCWHCTYETTYTKKAQFKKHSWLVTVKNYNNKQPLRGGFFTASAW